MGPEAASELEPAGAWKGFCLPGATGCWEGSAVASSARGVSSWWWQGCSQPALPGQCQPLWAGNGPVAGWHPRGRVCCHHGWEPVPEPHACGGKSHGHCRGVLCSSSCVPVPGENWDSCTSGCCLSALVWSWHACQLEKLDNCSCCPLEMGKGGLQPGF